MIIGEIRRYLRDNNSIRVSRSLRDTAYKALKAKEELIAKNGKEPTINEIAKEINMSKEDVDAHVRSLDQTAKYVAGGNIVKVIVVPGKIVNIVVK
jgi:RNA polymerase sporulation-specific sigma factor